VTRKIELTDAGIRHIKLPAAGFIDYPGSKITGFGIRVMKTGLKTFYFQYRFNNQRPRLNLGRYPDITLARARKKAEEARGLLRRGLNPKYHLQENDEEATHASEAVTGYTPPVPLFAQAVEDYITKHVLTNSRASTAKELSRNLRSTFLAVWSAKPLDEISSADVTKVIDAKLAEGKPGAANHALSNIKAFFQWCVARGMIKNSPARGIPKPAISVSRSRYLQPYEIRAVWLATEAEPNPISKLVQLALLTGQRRGEIAGMRWDELHINNGYWAIPGSRTKNGKDHIVPLSFFAVEVLRTITRSPLPLRPGDTEIRYSPLVFAAPRVPSKPLSDFSKPKARLDEHACIAHWCIHDLRRTVATGVAELGVLPKVKKKLFNHSESEVHDVYDRFEYFEERCEAMHRWAEFVKRAIAGEISTASTGGFRNPFLKGHGSE
jgi:integrase